MAITLLLLKKIIALFLIMLCGAVLVRSKVLKSEDSGVLAKVSMYLITPCCIVNAFMIEYTEEIARDLLLSLGAGAALLFLLLLLGRLLRKPLKLDPVEEVSIVYSNAGNLIIPLVSAMLGPEWVVFCSPFMCIQMLLLWTQAKGLLCGEKGLDLKALLTNVNLLAVIIGLILLLLRVRIPGILGDTVSTLGGMIGPVSMLVTGMLIGGMSLKSVFTKGRVFMVAALRLIVLPLILLAFIRLSGAASLSPNGSNILLISFLASISCAASTVTQMAQVFGRDAPYASAINVVTTLFCMLTMPLMVLLYQL